MNTIDTSSIRVRFAPSPTGYLHVGGARTALFNWLFAKKHKGKFILRIEDTDLERSSIAYLDSILNGLRWLGIDWDEGPYFQSQRVNVYNEFIQKLLSNGKIYHCFCTPETLEQMRHKQLVQKVDIKYDRRCLNLSKSEKEEKIKRGEKFVLRIKIPDNLHSIEWEDLVRGKISFLASQLDDFVVVKSDGMPTYNFAVVVDDISMQITHVIRGEDHISNTPKQIILYKALESPIPKFAHIPLILGKDKTRLSKRHGATSILEFQEQGFDPEAFRNFLAFLGWSHPDRSKQIFTIDEIINSFSLDKISKHGAIFDIEKLIWMNSVYIKNFSNEKLLNKLNPWLSQIPNYPLNYSKEQLLTMVSLLKERLKLYKDVIQMAYYFFNRPNSYLESSVNEIKQISNIHSLIKHIIQQIQNIYPFETSTIENKIRQFTHSNNYKLKDITHIIRIAISGLNATPGLFEILELLGKEEVINRIEHFANFIK